MTEVSENVSLKHLNTFGFDVNARFFVEINSIDSLVEILKNKKYENIPKLFLGGGSNVLFLQDFDGLILKINLKGIEIISETDSNVIVKAQAGEIWNDLVMFAVENNWGGIENLSLIPGTVGAAPMQNIGAYGVEIKDVFVQLEALNLNTLTIETFDKNGCEFGYRESFFKHQGKGKYVILNVSFCLTKQPEFKISYGAIKETMEASGATELSVKAISDAVVNIRQSKLPDPKDIGNSGSFFKNPEISVHQYHELKLPFDNMPSYVIDDKTVKVPAGWLIEQAGWKGYREGNVGVHDKQALVLVHHGNGKGVEIKNLALKIQKSVEEKFKIKISPEVNFIG